MNNWERWSKELIRLVALLIGLNAVAFLHMCEAYGFWYFVTIGIGTVGMVVHTYAWRKDMLGR